MTQTAGKTSDLFERLTQERQTPAEPQSRQCAAITRKGARCKAWAMIGSDQCAGHSQLYRLDPETGRRAAQEAAQQAAQARRENRLSVREKAAAALDDDWPDVLAALQAGLKEGSGAARARAAVSYVQLVYGRQLQAPGDERPTDGDALDVASMTRDERDALKRRLMAEHPEAASALGLVAS